MARFEKFQKLSLIRANPLAIGLILSSIILKSILLYFISTEETFLENDSTRYMDLASNFFLNYLSPGNSPNPDSFYVTPGYPLFLSLFGGLEIRQIIFIQFCILGVSQLLCYRILRNLFEQPIALLGLAMFLIESSTNLESFHILTETLFGLLFLCFLYFFSKSKNSKLNTIIAAVFLGSSLLVRPVAQILIVALIITFLISKEKKKIAICIFLSGAILSSWLLRNEKVFGIPQLSGIQSLNLLYYEGSGAVSISRSQTLEKAQNIESAREVSVLGDSPTLIDVVNYRSERGIALIKDNFLGFVELHARGSFKILLGPGSATIDEIMRHFPLGPFFGNILKSLSVSLSFILAFLSLFSIFRLIRYRQSLQNYFQTFVAVSFLLLLVSSGGANAYSRFRVPLVPLEILLSVNSITYFKYKFYEWKNFSTTNKNI